MKTAGWDEEKNTFKGNSIKDGDYITTYIKLLKEAETDEYLKQAYKDLKRSVTEGWDGFDQHMPFLLGIFVRSKLLISKDELCWDVGRACETTPISVFETVTRSFVLIGFDHCFLDRKTVAKTIGDILTSEKILMPDSEYIYAKICRAWLETEELGKDGEDSNYQLEQNLGELQTMQNEHRHAGTWFDAHDAEKVFCILSNIRSAWGNRTLPLEKVLLHITEDSPNSPTLYRNITPKPKKTVENYYRDWWSVVYRGLEGAYWLWNRKKENWTANKHIYVPTLRTLMKTTG